MPAEAAQAAARAPAPAPEPSLHTNPFREASRQEIFESIRQITEGNNTQRRIATVSGIPVIQRTYAASSIGGLDPARGETAALASGRNFLIIRHSKGMLMIGLPDEFGLTPQTQRALARGGYHEGDLPALERLIAGYRSSSYSISAIYLARPLDCLQFVNAVIAPTGARRVNPSTGVDLAGALSQPGSAIVETRASFLSADRRTLDPDRLSSFVRDARPGDVMMFLSRVPEVRTVGQARQWEEENGDRIIWLDGQNRQIDTRRLPPGTRPAGTPYHVGHTAVYAGLDAETQRPLVAQSHINSGAISLGPLDTYIMAGGRAFDAIAIVSNDYFAPSPVASAR